MPRAEPRPLELRDLEAERRARAEAEELLRDGAVDTAAAETFTGIGKSSLYELAAAGRLRTVKLGKKRLWPRRELVRLLAEHLETHT